MKRRDAIALLGAASAWPLAARGQKTAMPVIGFLAGDSAGSSKANLGGFRQGLRQTGYVEGQNLQIAFRYAEGRFERFPELAAQLVSLPVDVVAAFGASAAQATVSATKTLPVVFSSSADPIKLGLVESLNRPGRNATGVVFLAADLVGKQFELLHEMLPAASRMGLLVNPASANAEIELAYVPVAKKALGLDIVVQNTNVGRDLETAFAAFVQQQIAAVVVASDAFFYGERDRLIALGKQHSLPIMYYDREYVADGGLISYGTSLTDAYRQVGVFVGRILKGDKPADLPVQQAVKTELVINSETARALGIEMPISILLRVTETIE
jgi:putative tryptophan/tyrosine transport system substrate-binding protein